MPRRTDVLRAALVSMKHVTGDVEANLDRHLHWLEKAAAEGARFVGFPEFSLTGWVEAPEQAIALSHPSLAALERWAKARRIHVATCIVERLGRRRHNTTVFFGPRGRVGVMRKINLVRSELRHYTPGREFAVLDVAGCRMAVATCADATYYEMFHVPSLLGAEVIFAPAANSLNHYGNNPAGWRRWRMERWPRFCIDACVDVLGVTCAGLYSPARKDDEPTKFCSGGMAVDYRGQVVAQAPARTKRECMYTVELDLKALRQARSASRSVFQKSIIYPHLFPADGQAKP